MTSAIARALRHVWRAAGFSWSGIRAAFRDELAFRIEIAVLVAALPASFWLARSFADALGLIAWVLLTLAAELVNTAIEAAVDRVGAERHPLAKKAKDCGSAAVLVAALATALVWAGAAWEKWGASAR